MARARRGWGRRIAVALLVIVGGAYWWLLVESHAGSGVFHIDLAEVRRLAQEGGGAPPTQVRVEEVAHFRFPATVIEAGAGFEQLDMNVFSYQLVFADGTSGIIDTTMSAQLGEARSAQGFDAEAFGRVGSALAKAGFIVVTHEHFDHLGGLAAQPNLAALMPAVRLTREQIANLDGQAPMQFPKSVLAGYTPLTYDRYVRVAPGVVLIKAPGHTPGSQLVYVRRADGIEYLFLGDVAWHWDNVVDVRERARAVTLLIGEDRNAVMLQLAELHRLSVEAPDVRQLPGHDGARVGEMIAARFLVPHFLP